MRVAAALMIVVLVGASVRAHRIDEYLQATRLSIVRDRIVVDVTLTPGVSVASRVLEAIDRDGDARISPQEAEIYGGAVMRGVTLTVDGQRRALTLVRAESSSGDEMLDGAGAMRLEAVASLPAMARGAHAIVYDNWFEQRDGVYLVNALMPADPAITIRAQRRDRQQHRIELDVYVGATPSANEGIALLVGTTVVLFGVRRRSLRRAVQV